MQWAAGRGRGGVRARTRDCGVGPRAENRPKDCGNSGGGDRGLWMRGAGPGLREGRGLSGLWTCQDEQAQILGSATGAGERRILRPALMDRGLLRGRRDPEPAL